MAPTCSGPRADCGAKNEACLPYQMPLSGNRLEDLAPNNPISKECLKSFLVEVVIKQPELEEHAGIIRDHLGAFRRELDVLVERLRP